VLHRPDFQQRYQDGQIVNNVINALEVRYAFQKKKKKKKLIKQYIDV
jgi:hypothetical protein